MDKPLSDAFSTMSARAADADEQSFLHRHVRSLIADLEGADREDALINVITGLIILNGGLLDTAGRPERQHPRRHCWDAATTHGRGRTLTPARGNGQLERHGYLPYWGCATYRITFV